MMKATSTQYFVGQVSNGNKEITARCPINKLLSSDINIETSEI